MRVADEAWKGRGNPPSRKAPPPPPPSQPHSRRPPMPSPAGRMPPPQHMMHPSPRGPPPMGRPYLHPPPHHHPHHYMGPPPPQMMGHPSMGYSPMGMPMTPAGYHHNPPPPHYRGPSADVPTQHGVYPPPPVSRHSSRNPQPHVALSGQSKSSIASTDPTVVTPKTPAVRAKFDPATSRKNRKLTLGQAEPTTPFFGGKFPEQPKTTTLAIFSFLSNDDLYHAGLVCKLWSGLAMDDELWKFETR